MENFELKLTNKVINFESELDDWEGFIQEHYGEKKIQNQPHSKEVSAIKPAKKKMKMTYNFSKSTDHDSNLDFDVGKNLQQIDKKSDKTDAKYICEECQKEGCRLYCIGITVKNILEYKRYKLKCLLKRSVEM